MLHHFAHQAIDGRWHCVYRVPATQALASVMDAPCRQAVDAEARRLNAWQAKNNPLYVEPAERRLPKGLYDDKDAA